MWEFVPHTAKVEPALFFFISGLSKTLKENAMTILAHFLLLCSHARLHLCSHPYNKPFQMQRSGLLA